MSLDSKKRTIHAFFGTPAKKVKVEYDEFSAVSADDSKCVNNSVVIKSQDTKDIDKCPDFTEFSRHAAYPHPIANFPESILSNLDSLPASVGKVMNDQPDLDVLYFQPYVPIYLQREVFTFLRRELPFYRVEYDINRYGVTTHIKTPRYTTVFGLDATCVFDDNGRIIDAKTLQPVLKEPKYAKIQPRPLPACLDALRRSTEAATGETFNFCLVNYYASGSDSISYHSDDESFLGPLPSIASFSFGSRRDFLLKHKPIPEKDGQATPATKPIKLPLASGDMLLMRGKTQSCWLHSIPKRSGKNLEDGGRINITFRKAVVRGGTENYFRYNVGTGPVFRWDEKMGQMRLRDNNSIAKS